ncbi:MAG: hypothetical protein U0800_10620, partial [Isosphaeraceae bacterium]
EDPELAADRGRQIPYNAACSAILATSGKGADTVEEDARAELRAQALNWLVSERDAWAKAIESGSTEDRANAALSLNHWHQDSDLEGVRNAEELAKLPEDERRSWQAFWEEVEALLKRASTPEKPPNTAGP